MGQLHLEQEKEINSLGLKFSIHASVEVMKSSISTSRVFLLPSKWICIFTFCDFRNYIFIVI